MKHVYTLIHIVLSKLPSFFFEHSNKLEMVGLGHVSIVLHKLMYTHTHTHTHTHTAMREEKVTTLAALRQLVIHLETV